MVNHRLETPRPDLKEDYDLWRTLFQETDYNSKAYTILHGFRCGGAKLMWDDERLRMKPRTGENALWDSKEEYKEDRDRWLMSKYKKDVIKAIRTTQKEVKKRDLLPIKG